MDIGSLAKLGVKHVKNHAAQSVYLHSGVNWTSPTNFCGLVTHQCNLYCGFCFDRKDVDPSKEMNFEEWKQALLSIKTLAGDYFISFSGGEVMLMKWFPDLLQHCADNGIKGGVLTNGTAINEKTAPRLVAADPFELSLSIDGPTPEIHDLIRGRKGAFAMVCKAVSLFRQERDRQGKQFPIIIRCVINRLNFEAAPAMIDLVREIGATAIVFQPVHEIGDKVMTEWKAFAQVSSDSLMDNFWLDTTELDSMDRIKDQLLALKRAGAPIMNTERDLNLLTYHFRREKPGDMARTCTVHFCHDWPPIGNLRQQNAREIWYGDHAEDLRAKAIHCDKLCLVNCSTQRTLLEKVSMAMNLLRN